MVEVDGEDVGLDAIAIVYDDFTLDGFVVWQALCSEEVIVCIDG